VDYRLEPDERPGASLRAVVDAQLASASALLDERSGRQLDEAVHEARKCVKRSRAALRLASAVLGGAGSIQSRVLRDSARGLAGSRDARVRLDTLDGLVRRDRTLSPEAVATLRARLEEEWRATVEREPPAGGGVRDGLASVRERLAGLPFESLRWKHVVAGLERTMRRGRERHRALASTAAGEGLDEEFHEWRKRVKDLGYQLRLVEPAWPAVIGALAGECERLWDLVGEDHDLLLLRERAVAPERLGDFSTPADRQVLVGVVDARRARLQRRALTLGDRIYTEPSGRFAREIQRYTGLWRAKVTEGHEK
jgi:CHAD domain-containing protein